MAVRLMAALRLAAAVLVALWAASGAADPQFAKGIQVTGHASIAVEPDVAVLRVGVQATAKTVAEARRQAAEAVAAIDQAAKDKGLADDDMQTISFGIQPEYRYTEAGPVHRNVLVGYTVSHAKSIKLRDLSAVGEIIDHVAEAGGDAVRMRGIDFDIENPEPHMAALRERAVAEARAKAVHFASLTGVAVGELLYITETSGRDAPWPRPAAMLEARAAATPISAGELELELSVKAVFAID